MSTTATKPLHADAEIERIAKLLPEELTAEDLRHLKRIRDTRASLLEVERELDEVKERRKLRQETHDQAILEASIYFDRRQMAFSFGQ